MRLNLVSGLFGASLFAITLSAQQPASTAAADVKPRANAVRASQSPIIDGKEDDAVWKSAQAYSDFVEFQPTEGMLTRRLRFEAGARTNWHTHTHRQMIWAEEGRGLYQEMGEPVKQLVKDVPILTKANVPHWHGAAPDSYVVQLTIYGGDIKWGAPVTDAEYLGKVGSRK